PDSIPTLHSQTMTGMLYLHEVRLMRFLFSRSLAVMDCTAAPSLAWKCHDIEPQPAQCTGRVGSSATSLLSRERPCRKETVPTRPEPPDRRKVHYAHHEYLDSLPAAPLTR